MTGTSAIFTWTPGDGALEYSLFVGTTVGGQDLYTKSQGLSTSVTVNNLPVGGGTVYVRLYTRFATGWQFTDYTYTAATATKATLTSPAPSSTLTGTSATFTWTPGVGALEYCAVRRDHRRGAGHVHQHQGLNTSVTVNNLPAGGGTVYVRLYTRFATGWQFTDYTYTAATASQGRPHQPGARPAP